MSRFNSVLSSCFIYPPWNVKELYNYFLIVFFLIISTFILFSSWESVKSTTRSPEVLISVALLHYCPQLAEFGRHPAIIGFCMHPHSALTNFSPFFALSYTYNSALIRPPSVSGAPSSNFSTPFRRPYYGIQFNSCSLEIIKYFNKKIYYLTSCIQRWITLKRKKYKH